MNDFNYNNSAKFKKLKNLEESSGFIIGKDKNFFRKGDLKNDDISKKIQNELIDLFEEKMREFVFG